MHIGTPKTFIVMSSGGFLYSVQLVCIISCDSTEEKSTLCITIAMYIAPCTVQYLFLLYSKHSIFILIFVDIQRISNSFNLLLN